MRYSDKLIFLMAASMGNVEGIHTFIQASLWVDIVAQSGEEKALMKRYSSFQYSKGPKRKAGEALFARHIVRQEGMALN